MISLRILAAVVLLCAIIAPAHAQKTKAAITSEINTQWPDNVVGAITPAKLRATILDIVNSYVDANGGSSLPCAAHQWIAAISTLSSVSCTQPAFTDISGQTTLAQLPQLTSNSIYINATNSAGQPLSTAVPACAADGSHALTYVNGTGLQCVSLSTGGTVTSVACGAGLSGGTITTTGTCSVTALAVAVTTPTGPSATTDATGKMMGIGGGTGACTLTPPIGTKIKITIDGFIANGTSAQNSNLAGLRFGTGAAPANGAALSGTVIGANPSGAFKAAASPQSAPFSVTRIATGLTSGVAVWFDLGLQSTAASSASIGQLTCTMEEML